MQKRKFLKLMGGGFILAAGVGIGGFAATRTPSKALAPWQDAGSNYAEPRKRAISYAILAPNPHNRQPWLVDLSKEGNVTLFVDEDKLLPHTDPFNRQIVIGLGCFIEIMRMAAAQDGYDLKINYFPDGFSEIKLDHRAIANIEFIADAQVEKDPLFAHVLDRRSLKKPYDLRKEIPNEALQILLQSVGNNSLADATNEKNLVEKLRELTSAADMVEFETDRTYKESVDLFRIGKSEVEASPDGISFSGMMFDILSMTGIFTRRASLDRQSTLYAQAVDMMLENSKSAMGYIWLVTKDNTRLDQINAGIDYVRINLAATSLGLGIHPKSQALQEYQEMDALYRQGKKLLAPNGNVVQMLARLGYASASAPTPRWQLDEKIIKG